jgi:hypothetical protein
MFADAAGTVIIPSRLLGDAFDMAHNIETQDFEFIDAIRNRDPEEVRRGQDLLQTCGKGSWRPAPRHASPYLLVSGAAGFG